MDTLVKYLAKKAKKCSQDQFTNLLEKLGWEQIGSGCSKRCYGKKGVPLIVKVGFFRDTDYGLQKTPDGWKVEDLANGKFGKQNALNEDRGFAIQPRADMVANRIMTGCAFDYAKPDEIVFFDDKNDTPTNRRFAKRYMKHMTRFYDVLAEKHGLERHNLHYSFRFDYNTGNIGVFNGKLLAIDE